MLFGKTGTQQEGTRRSPKSVIVHPKYTFDHEYDFAIVTLSRGIRRERINFKNIKRAPMPLLCPPLLLDQLDNKLFDISVPTSTSRSA